MNIASVLFPAFNWQYLLLRDMVPVRPINDSGIATVVVGILLILLADGLARHNRRAMWLTLAILAVSATAYLVKSVDYAEVLVCLSLAGVLCIRRGDHVVQSRPVDFRKAVGIITFFGLLSYGHYPTLSTRS